MHSRIFTVILFLFFLVKSCVTRNTNTTINYRSDIFRWMQQNYNKSLKVERSGILPQPKIHIPVSVPAASSRRRVSSSNINIRNIIDRNNYDLPKINSIQGLGIKRTAVKYNGPTLKILDKDGGIGKKKKKIYRGSRPHILVFLADDLGFHDVGYHPEPRDLSTAATPYMTNLAKNEGIYLENMYVHWHCSPSRRSFISGRVTIHAGGDRLTHHADDDLDTRFTWISEKLKLGGYTNFFYGKHHMGVKTVDMLPTRRGFDYYNGILGGSEKYEGGDRWLNLKHNKASKFSTEYWGESMKNKIEQILNNGDEMERIFLYASFQTPHSPLETPKSKKYTKPNKKMNVLDHNMYAMDVEMNEVITLFKSKREIWDNTLVLFMSDNGGTTTNSFGNNWPLRSEKGSNFEGGLRGTSFISGGIIPSKLRGTTNKHVFHISDWYRTFCNLAGVDALDSSPDEMDYPNAKPEDVIDPQFPNIIVNEGNGDVEKNIYGNSYPPLDSIDIWEGIVDPSNYGIDHFHPTLVLSSEAFLVEGKYKLILAQPCSMGINDDKPCKTEADFGWVDFDKSNVWEKFDEKLGCLKIFDDRKGIDSISFQPCLFDLSIDPAERNPLKNEDKIKEIWELFNRSLVFQYNYRLAGKEFGVSPESCLGTCKNSNDAAKFFNIKRENNYPHCGLNKIKDDDEELFC